MLSLSLCYISFVRYSVIESVRQIDHLLFSKLTCILLHKAHQYQYRTHLTGDKMQLGK